MKYTKPLLLGLLAGSLCATSNLADERRFTFVYEPETLPAGAMEFENWVTLRSQRSKAVGQENFNRWDLRQELEYGVTDRYTVSLYLNETAKSYRDPASGANESEFAFEGISLENRFMVLNPAEHKVGLTLYAEGRFSGEEAEIEEKLILGQRHGLWKWALNLEHATEWEDNLRETEAELGASFGLARDFGKHWSVGLELRNHTVLADYRTWENSAVFLGPAVSYHREKWWATLSVLPQIYGWNFHGHPDGSRRLELVDHEKINIRLLFGFNF